MNCVCETNEKGEVISPCGAHMEWLRYATKLNRWEEKAKELDQAKKDLEFQTKRANTFEKLLIDYA